MNDIRLTTRGKVVFGAFIAALSVATFWMLLDIVTPEECKVSRSEMSAACEMLIYDK
jgi:hypothetical protein